MQDQKEGVCQLQAVAYLVLKINPVWIIGMHVCVCPRPKLLITNGVMWRDLTPHDWLNKFYSCFIATVAVIINGYGLGIDMHHGN